MSGADYHKQSADAIKADDTRNKQIETLMNEKFERWSALEEKAKSGK